MKQQRLFDGLERLIDFRQTIIVSTLKGEVQQVSQYYERDV